MLSDVQVGPMDAWLITWEWANDAAAVADHVASILSVEWPQEQVRDFVELLYLHRTSTPAELATLAGGLQSNPYPAKAPDHARDRFDCGHNPHLYARQVTELTVTGDEETSFETIRWCEPDGQVRCFTRQRTGRLADEPIWDRTTTAWKDGYAAPDLRRGADACEQP